MLLEEAMPVRMHFMGLGLVAIAAEMLPDGVTVVVTFRVIHPNKSGEEGLELAYDLFLNPSLPTELKS